MSSDPEPLSPEQEAAVAKVRRLTMISSATLIIGIGAVFGVIGYKVFRSGDKPAASAARAVVEAADRLPPGGKVTASAISEGRLMVTIESAAGTELRTYDVETLRPLGRLRLTP